MKKYNSAPLPFQGQKRNFKKHFFEALEDMPQDTTFLDLFGGSGLLSHWVKEARPNARVIWNDYDNYHKRLELIPITNEIINGINSIVKDAEIEKKLSAEQKNEIDALLDSYDEEDIDTLTIGSVLLFSGRHVRTLAELKKATYYARKIKKPYSANGYLDGVKRVHGDFMHVFANYTTFDAVLILDPPYLSTSQDGYKNRFGLCDFLRCAEIMSPPFICFGSERSELGDFIAYEQRRGTEAFMAMKARRVSTTVNSGVAYRDFIYWNGDNKGDGWRGL